MQLGFVTAITKKNKKTMDIQNELPMAPSQLSSVNSNDIHLRAISQEIVQPKITSISFKIAHVNIYLNLPGANELKINFLWIKKFPNKFIFIE